MITDELEFVLIKISRARLDEFELSERQIILGIHAGMRAHSMLVFNILRSYFGLLIE